MAAVGLTSIVFPIGVGTCIVVFTLYTNIRLRETLAPRDCLGLALTLAGMACIAWPA